MNIITKSIFILNLYPKEINIVPMMKQKDSFIGK